VKTKYQDSLEERGSYDSLFSIIALIISSNYILFYLAACILWAFKPNAFHPYRIYYLIGFIFFAFSVYTLFIELLTRSVEKTP